MRRPWRKKLRTTRKKAGAAEKHERWEKAAKHCHFVTVAALHAFFLNCNRHGKRRPLTIETTDAFVKGAKSVCHVRGFTDVEPTKC